ncbi:peptide chain release factor 2 [Candidatus Uhrbacteria bacterium RIFCSPHIGHO2_12_FULL_60_25]|uniref:Peptide chain release factor 2 n=1 Tax=Candidatus Uhrbacteria bacterium RIFCSPHIGHO2_12_FULL_60_25 TaxID=1802399 RepID=A0A1F7UMV6_9BACT|nr:MAG: peptide chain release factor 2 [Candidatus Uhrbacteria bacterium RIFCSPHIGHO2_12_FULL_60_25]
MSPIMDRVTHLRSRVDEAWRVLDLDAVKHEIAALEVEASSQDFWSDQERARRESQKLADLKEQYDRWAALRASTVELQELLELVEAEKDVSLARDAELRAAELEKTYLSLEFSMLFSGEHDASNAVLAIHAGAGGTDAQDWAEILMRMYFRYAEKKGWRVRLVDESRGTEAGIKSATFFVEGRYAFGHLKGEAGVHRLVRLSPFNADQLRQTSFALVEVLPEFDETIEVEIKPEDLRIDTFMSGGKGGQSVNTTYSAVRIVHLPTKITVSCQNERSQTQNKATAMKILKAKLLKLKEEEVLKERQELRGEYHSAEWGNQIRSYVLQPYRMVKDHRTDVETSDTDGVLNGDLDLFIEGYLRHQAEGQDKRAEMNRDV